MPALRLLVRIDYLFLLKNRRIAGSFTLPTKKNKKQKTPTKNKNNNKVLTFWKATERYT